MIKYNNNTINKIATDATVNKMYYGGYLSYQYIVTETPSRLPSGYTEVEYVENTSKAYLNLNAYIYDTTGTSYAIETKLSSSYHNNEFEYLFATEGTSSPYNGMGYRWNRHTSNSLQFFNVPENATFSSVDNGDGTSGVTVTCSSAGATNNVPLSLFCGIWSSGPWRNGQGKFYTFKLTKNDVLIRDLVPCKRDNDNMVGMYDLVNDVFYYPPNYTSYQLIAGGEV